MENNGIFKTIAAVNVANPKVSEQIKNYKQKYNSYTPETELTDSIMWNQSFSLNERYRILYDVAAYLYGVNKADNILIDNAGKRFV